MASSVGPGLPLEEFLRLYDMPVTVVVTRGYSSADKEEDSLSNGEVITLHGTEVGQVILASKSAGYRKASFVL